MTKILTLIPARLNSTRFPAKPMAALLGKPMIGHVYERVSRNKDVTLTAVATCDKEIADYVSSIGGKAIMTSSNHERASDRCAEALEIIEREGNLFDIIVMVQGDEPMTHANMVSEAVEPMLKNPNILVVNLMGRIESIEEFEDRNCIKVVCDLNRNALYFSREPIPTRDKTESSAKNKQVCVIPFRHDFLLDYTRMEPTPLEITESIDMLRILEHGKKVRMAPTKYQTHSVDTPDDLQKVEALMQSPNFN